LKGKTLLKGKYKVRRLAVDKACPAFPCCYITRETCLSQNLIFDTELNILNVTSACALPTNVDGGYIKFCV
jgi:hypothetical protein